MNNAVIDGNLHRQRRYRRRPRAVRVHLGGERTCDAEEDAKVLPKTLRQSTRPSIRVTMQEGGSQAAGSRFAEHNEPRVCRNVVPPNNNVHSFTVASCDPGLRLLNKVRGRPRRRRRRYHSASVDEKFSALR